MELTQTLICADSAFQAMHATLCDNDFEISSDITSVELLEEIAHNADFYITVLEI